MLKQVTLMCEECGEYSIKRFCSTACRMSWLRSQRKSVRSPAAQAAESPEVPEFPELPQFPYCSNGHHLVDSEHCGQKNCPFWTDYVAPGPFRPF